MYQLLLNGVNNWRNPIWKPKYSGARSMIDSLEKWDVGAMEDLLMRKPYCTGFVPIDHGI